MMIYVLILCMLSGTIAYNKAVCEYYQEYDLDLDEDILDHASLFNQTDIVLTTNKIIFLDEFLNVVNEISAPSNGSHQCDRVFSHKTQDIFFVVCQAEEESPYLAAFKRVENTTSYEQFGVYNYFSSEETITKVELIGNTLLVQQSNSIIFYTIVIQTSQWYIKPTSYILDQRFFERSSLNITDFSSAPYIQDLQQYYRIFVVDYNDGILWVDAILRTNNLIPYNSGLINLRQSYYISYTSRFRGSVLVETTYNRSQFVVQTYDDGAFHFGASYLSSTNVQLYFYLALNKYKEWTPISTMKYSNGAVAIPYQNYQKTVVTSLFKIYTDQITKSSKELAQEPTDILVSAAIDTFVLYFTQGNNLVYRSDVDQLSRCSLSNYQ